LVNKEKTTFVVALILGFTGSFHSEWLGWLAGLGSYIFLSFVQRGSNNSWDERL